MSANRVENLVYWYLRFNGYLTVENFTVHPDFKKSPEAEADILAVRFPYSVEDPRNFHFERDLKIIRTDRIDFVIGEVKTGRCAINPSWQEPGRENIQYALRWFGFLSEAEIETVASTVCQHKQWQDDRYSVHFVCFGREPDTDLQAQYPQLLQVSHSQIVEFIYRRLTTNCMALHRENWNDFIREFVNLIERGHQPEQILKWVLSKE